MSAIGTVYDKSNWFYLGMTASKFREKYLCSVVYTNGHTYDKQQVYLECKYDKLKFFSHNDYKEGAMPYIPDIDEVKEFIITAEFDENETVAMRMKRIYGL